MSVWAIVVAGGVGTRFGEPKQFLSLRGERLVDRAVASATRTCDAVVVVLPSGVSWDGPEVAAAVAGGARRADSVRAGLVAVPADADVIVVHDAVRPLASPTLFASVIDAVHAGADAAVPAVPLTDTIKRVEGNRVVETLERESLVAVQTPQAFRAAALRAAHAGGDDATDDAALVERAGGHVTLVAGEPRNRKVTEPDDLAELAGLEDAS